MPFFLPKKECFMQNKRSVIVLQTTENELYECSSVLKLEFNVIGCFCDGVSGIKAIAQAKPDFVITSLVLTGQDGFAVLGETKKNSPATKSIVLGEFSDSNMIMRAINAGASYYMLRPVNYKMLIERMKLLLIEPQPPKDSALFVAKPQETPAEVNAVACFENEKAEAENIAARGNSIAARGEKSDEDKERSINERLSQIFISIGMPPNIKGYAYLKEAVKLAVKTPEVINSVTKRLYPTVALKFDTSASKVERAIRHAIEVAWNKGRVEVLNSLFGVRAYSESEKPTNSEFIALIADRLLLDGFD